MAMLGDTIIIGGFLNTELIRAKSIVAEMLAVEDLAAITGKFSGDVWVGGDIVVGGQGVLSVFQFESSGGGSWGDSGGWSSLGLMEWELTKGRMGVTVFIPDNFTVTRATIYLYAMPMFYDNPAGLGSHPTKWKQSRNLRLYHSDGTEGYHYRTANSGDSQVLWRSGVNITSAVLGVSAWSPTLAYSGTDPNNTSNKIQIRSGDLTNYLSSGMRRTFYVETTDAGTEANYAVNEGLGKMIVLVEGYTSVSQ
ncbi:MAG TPA: hypothetical protein VFC74_00255 [Oscillospiraceae bacterium]|nr:hypothetical protein [Oscillospiraceae bacterium]